ncbi:MAG: hypothetical protein ACO373_05640, partial [Pontimonas sp.]
MKTRAISLPHARESKSIRFLEITRTVAGGRGYVAVSAIINHYVGGAEFVGESERLSDVFDPALG